MFFPSPSEHLILRTRNMIGNASNFLFLLLLLMVECFGETKSSVITETELSCAPCNCYKLVATDDIVMNCSNNNFHEVPEFIRSSDRNFTNVTHLYLNNNFITRLDGQPFRELPKLQSLYLGYNELNEIGNLTFNKMKLINLELNGNQLTNESFAKLAFEGLDVITLDLSRNQLSEPPKALSHTVLITNLILHHNPMRVLRHGAFKNFGTPINSLDISDCELYEIEPDIFNQRDLTSLKDLFLDNNNFSRLNASFFENARVTDKLSIQNSNIQSIEKNTFKDFSHIKYLYLNKNNLGDALDRKAFNKLKVEILQLRECGITRLTTRFLQIQITKTLDLSGNNISVIHSQAFKGLKYVSKIILSNSNIKEIKNQPFTELAHPLKELYLNDNKLDNRSLNFLGSLLSLTILDISNNDFQAWPNLTGVPKLHDLYAMNNKFRRIEADTFNSSHSITNLRISGNSYLEYIAEDAFLHLTKLTELDLRYSSVKKLPNLQTMQRLVDINVAHAKLEVLPDDLCKISSKLTKIDASYNNLNAIPTLTNCSSLSVLFFDFNKIKRITENNFQGLDELMTLFLHNNEIEEIHPEAFQGLKSLSRLHLQFNRISSLPKGVFDGLTDLGILLLQHNQITSIPTDLFKDMVHLQTLYLNDNSISDVGKPIFPANMTWLQKMNISNNPLISDFPFPKAGFPFLHTYSMMNLPLMLNAPSLSEIPRIQYIYVTYPYHCCIYKDHLPDKVLVIRRKQSRVSLENPTADDNSTIEETIWIITRPTGEPLTLPPHILEGHIFPDKQDPYNPSQHFITEDDLAEALKDYAFQDNLSIQILPNNEISLVGVDNNETITFGALSINSLKMLMKLPDFNNFSEVSCSPAPTAFMPCTSLLDPDPVRVLIWVVWFPAILGNIAVIFVIMASSEKVDVPNFILCNLALADFMLGIYLSFLAVVDVRTFGDGSFYKSALHWQHGPGCKTAGFIGVFSCELSTYLMVILTLERLHTIVYSFNQHGSRMKMWHAVILVVIGWVFAMASAVLPLFDVSSYTDVAVCLPFRADYLQDKVYVGSLLSLSVVASLIILFSYIHILVICCKSPAIDGRERIMTSVKMGILVVSNFACWLPFGVLGLAAIADEYLVNLTVAKYFIVLILPINACLNPFLYTISKKTFWQKCQMICKKSERKHIQDLRMRRNSLVSAASTTSGYQQDMVDMGLLYRRQNRRSFSLQMEAIPNVSSSSSSTSNTPKSSSPVLFGRRNSSPAIFGIDNSTTGTGRRAKRMPSDPTLLEQTDGVHLSSHVVVRAQTESNRTNSNCLSVVHEETSICGSDDDDMTNDHDSDIQSPFRFSAELKALQRANSDTRSKHCVSEYVRRSIRPYSNNSIMMAATMDNESDCSSCGEYDDARSSPLPPQFTPPSLLEHSLHNPLEEDTGYCDSEELNRYSSTTVDTHSSGYSEATTSRSNHFEVNEIINPHINKPMKGIVESTC